MARWVQKVKSLLPRGNESSTATEEKTTGKLKSLNQRTSLTQFTYDTLLPQRRQIRLIQVWRGSSYQCSSLGDDEFGCTIHTFDHHEAPHYIALSYTWGKPNPSRLILVNGKLCCVRENLYNFLNTFSKPQTAEERDYLWIDQICIDQSDVGERNHQVGMMADIYRNCDFVITWLDASASKGADSIRDGWVFDQLQHPEVNMERIAYKCVNKFLKNRYFTRLWIVQEVLLAPEVLILCANIWLEWNDVKKAILSVQAHWFDRLPDAKFLFTRREQNYGPGRFRMREDFPVYLTLYSSMGCVDPRDKVYGLLGLAGTEQRDFVVDYNKPVQEVLFDVVQFVTFRETSKYSTEFIEAGAKAICKNMRLPKDDTTALNNLFDDVVQVPFISQWGYHRSTRDSAYCWWYELDGIRFYYFRDGRFLDMPKSFSTR